MIRLVLSRLAFILALAWGGCAIAAGAGSDLVLVVHPDSGVEQLSRNQTINIFMGRHRQLPSGIAALPLDLAPERETFYRLLTNKTLAEINAYWARLIFSGRTSSPRQVYSAAEMLDLVADNKGAIGYLRREDLDDRVKAVTTPDGWQQPAAGTGP